MTQGSPRDRNRRATRKHLWNTEQPVDACTACAAAALQSAKSSIRAADSRVGHLEWGQGECEAGQEVIISLQAEVLGTCGRACTALHTFPLPRMHR